MQNLGVQARRSPQASSAPLRIPLDDPGFVDFAVAGTEISGEFRCTDCGYGAVVHRALPQCPMCGNTVWESQAPRFAD